jgi:hypothetical protein
LARVRINAPQREIREEAGIDIPLDHLRMIGIVSEKAYEGRHHWLIFLFTVKRPVQPAEIARMDMDEGKLEWHDIDAVERLPIPDTDLRVMWPGVRKHRDGFFMVHIDCSTMGSGQSFLPHDRRVVDQDRLMRARGVAALRESVGTLPAMRRLPLRWIGRCIVAIALVCFAGCSGPSVTYTTTSNRARWRGHHVRRLSRVDRRLEREHASLHPLLGRRVGLWQTRSRRSRRRAISSSSTCPVTAVRRW